MEKVMSGGGINWCWYVFFIDHGDGTVTVTMHDRWHRFRDHDHPVVTHAGSYSFVETADREAVALCVDGEEKKLRNPGYVFGFGAK